MRPRNALLEALRYECGPKGYSFGLLALTAGVPPEAETKSVTNEFPQESISRADGLANWQKFYEVASHPRCRNCHVGPNNIPMRSGPSYDKPKPHGMKINAGPSRVGAETVPCTFCRSIQAKTNAKTNALPHSPPKVAMTWALPPVKAAWFGKSSTYICNQLKNP